MPILRRFQETIVANIVRRAMALELTRTWDADTTPLDIGSEGA